jgi:hypothetical protein
MGVCIQVLRHLLAGKRDGVSYARTAMIGRQSLHVSIEQLQEALRYYLGQTRTPEETLAMMGDGFLEGILRALGASRIEAVDYSAYEGATLVHDLNQPLPSVYKGRFTAVIDGGSLEHVFDFPRAVRNCMEMLAVGGHFLGITCANNFMGHGFYQFSPELYFRVFSPENGFQVEKMFVCETHAEGKWYAVADPQVVGARVTLVNHQPTFLMVRARKIQEKEVFAQTPLQSDYVATWNPQAAARSADGDGDRPSSPAAEAAINSSTLKEHLAGVLPSPAKALLRPPYRLSRHLLHRLQQLVSSPGADTAEAERPLYDPRFFRETEV